METLQINVLNIINSAMILEMLYRPWVLHSIKIRKYTFLSFFVNINARDGLSQDLHNICAYLYTVKIFSFNFTTAFL